MKNCAAYICILLSIILAGCHSSKQIVEPKVEWNELTLPFKLNIEGSVSPGGKAYFQRDRDIHLSVRYFGMEILSFYANTDSVFLYDKTHNILIEDALGNNPLTHRKMTINQLQDFLLGINEYALDIDFHLYPITINIQPNEIIENKGNRMVGKWDIDVHDVQKVQVANANLVWNYNNSAYNETSVPRWKRPTNPKQVLQIKDIYRLLTNNI